MPCQVVHLLGVDLEQLHLAWLVVVHFCGYCFVLDWHQEGVVFALHQLRVFEVDFTIGAEDKLPRTASRLVNTFLAHYQLFFLPSLCRFHSDSLGAWVQVCLNEVPVPPLSLLWAHFTVIIIEQYLITWQALFTDETCVNIRWRSKLTTLNRASSLLYSWTSLRLTAQSCFVWWQVVLVIFDL